MPWCSSHLLTNRFVCRVLFKKWNFLNHFFFCGPESPLPLINRPNVHDVASAMHACSPRSRTTLPFHKFIFISFEIGRVGWAFVSTVIAKVNVIVRGATVGTARRSAAMCRKPIQWGSPMPVPQRERWMNEWRKWLCVVLDRLERLERLGRLKHLNILNGEAEGTARGGSQPIKIL